MNYNYIIIDESLSTEEQAIQRKGQISIMLGVNQTDKMLSSKLALIPRADLHTRVYDFDRRDIYPGHYHILKYMLNNGYLTSNVIDFSTTIANITETGGGCMYAMLDVHTKFLTETRRLYTAFDEIKADTFPFLDRCPYLDELNKYHETKKQIVPEIPDEIVPLFVIMYNKIMRHDIPNIVYLILTFALIKTI